MSVSCSVVSDSMTLHTVDHKVLLSMGFPRPEFWTGLPFPSPGDLPNPGIEPRSPLSPALQADSLNTEPLGKPQVIQTKNQTKCETVVPNQNIRE